MLFDVRMDPFVEAVAKRLPDAVRGVMADVDPEGQGEFWHATDVEVSRIEDGNVTFDVTFIRHNYPDWVVPVTVAQPRLKKAD